MTVSVYCVQRSCTGSHWSPIPVFAGLPVPLLHQPMVQCSAYGLCKAFRTLLSYDSLSNSASNSFGRGCHQQGCAVASSYAMAVVQVHNCQLQWTALCHYGRPCRPRLHVIAHGVAWYGMVYRRTLLNHTCLLDCSVVVTEPGVPYRLSTLFLSCPGVNCFSCFVAKTPLAPRIP